MTNRTKIIDGKKYHLISSYSTKPSSSKVKFHRNLLGSNTSVRTVKLTKAEAKFEGAKYRTYVR